MPAYTIDYLWVYNPHGPDGGAYADQEIPMKIRYHIQPDEPDVNVKFEITIEEINDLDGNPYCTDAAFECGWYQSDEERLLDWLYDNFENGKLTKQPEKDSEGA